MEDIDKKKGKSDAEETFWSKYVKGMQDLNNKKKIDLAKLGIRTLQRTPGKLINPRGYIPGALGAFGIVWGRLTGPKETVEKLVGMKLKQGAIGALLSRHKYVDKNGKVKFGIFAISLMPRQNTPTEKVKLIYERIRVLNKIASRHMHDIIYPIWDPLVTNKSRKPWSGYHFFQSLNLKNIGTSLNWSNLLISNGKLPPPKHVCPNRYDPEKKLIHIVLPRTIRVKLITINQIGLAVLDIITGDFFHISPEQITEQVEQRFNSCGFTPSQLRRGGINPNFKPLKFTWKIEQIRKNYYPPTHWAQKWFSPFYLFIYYKKLIPSTHPSSLPSELVIPHNSQYSPSICSRIRVFKNRRAKRKGFHIIVHVVSEAEL